VDRCLEKDPDKRPQSGTHLADHLTPAPVATVASSPNALRKLLTLGRRWAVLAPLYVAALAVVGLPVLLAEHLNLRGDLRVIVLSATWVVLLPPLLLTAALVRRLFRHIATLADSP
jgi:hypothetical protein